MRKSCCPNSTLSSKIEGFISRQFVFSCILRMFLEGYLELCLSTFINFKYLEVNSSGQRFSTIWTFTMMGIVVLLPPSLAIFCLFFRPKLTEFQFQQRFGSLYDNLDIARPISVLYYPAFTLRRLLFSWTAVFLVESSILQIQVFTICSFLYSIYLIGARPFKTRTLNNLEIMNEAGVNMFAILLYLLTPLVKEGESRLLIGWILIGLIAGVMVLNILTILWQTLSSSC